MISLQVLNLDSIQLRSDSIHQIATNLPNLTELNLRNTWLSKRAVLSLANHLTAVNIEKLNLGGLHVFYFISVGSWIT
jgi:hypothetical protein